MTARELPQEALDAAEKAALLMPVLNRQQSSVMLWALTDTPVIRVILEAAWPHLCPDVTRCHWCGLLIKRTDSGRWVDDSGTMLCHFAPRRTHEPSIK